MMRINKLFLGFVLLSSVLSCGKDSPSSKDPVVPPIKKEIPKWNKNKTIQMSFISSLDDKEMSSAELKAIAEHIDKSKSELFLVEGTNTTFYEGKLRNTSTKLAFDTGLFSTFNLNSYKGLKEIKGSTLLFKHKVNGEKAYFLSQGAYMKKTIVHARAMVDNGVFIDTPFATARLETQEQLTNLLKLVKGFDWKNDVLFVGSAKPDLVKALEEFSQASTKYKLSVIEAGKEQMYKPFILAPKTWVLRNQTTLSLNNKLLSIELQIEASVE